MNYAAHIAPSSTPQSEPILGRESLMAENNAGGFSFKLDKWKQLERFLVLGTEGGTYYVGEHQLTRENASVILACAKDDGPRVVATIVRFRRENRAPKMNTLIFVLAVCSKLCGKETATAANAAIGICGTATHLFMFLKYVKELGGTGAGTRRAIARWYNGRSPSDLAYQVAKYKNREGWTHRDALRVGHVVPATPEHGDVLAYATGKTAMDSEAKPHRAVLYAAGIAAAATAPSDVIELIHDFDLPWECIPSELMKSPEVNEALLQRMPMTATVRQLGRMTAVGLLGPMSDTAKLVIDRISDDEAIKKSRMHPIQVLAALSTYASGHGARGSLTWTPNQAIVDALDGAFYASFGNVEPTGKRTYLALDVSGSMAWSDIAGIPGLTPRMASAAMAMVTARAEAPGSYVMRGFADRMEQLGITPRDRLDTTVHKISHLGFGRTDCALPMLDALKTGIEVDTFVIYTDSETYVGTIHPCEALKKYRKETGIPAKLVVVGMTSTGFTIADPEDSGTLDVVGFDTAAPQVISDFARS